MKKPARVALTPVEVDTLFDLILSRQTSGAYYGPQKQYRKRLERLIEKLKLAARAAEGGEHGAG